MNLDHYDALEIRIRTDGRLYVAQIKTETNIEDDLYQVVLPPVKPDTWTRVILPFDEFMLTWRGYAEEEQIPLSPTQIRHIALLMAERRDGPFEIHVDWVRAVRTRDLVDHQSRFNGKTKIRRDE